jgi:hypothetical protein
LNNKLIRMEIEYFIIRALLLFIISCITSVIIKIINYDIAFNIILNNVCLTYLIIIVINNTN